MRLKSVQLSGFKSFVDRTVINVSSGINAIVGPNGCGKSNIVDAIRWVVGESSAKQLRGQAMSDVIFNGTKTRQPVSHCSVECCFDHTGSGFPGPLSAYRELSIKRELSRDGQSVYRLNGTVCRRRDILDVFLGTGLGARSYAVIEQGVISRIIEAKPEELRSHLEEAAGVSRYKERRRETEHRIRHTQENLDRVNDICEELDKQLRHLSRQAKAAERYQQYQAELVEIKSQLFVAQWQQLKSQDQRAEQQHQALEEALAQLQAKQQEQERALSAQLLSHETLKVERDRVQQSQYELHAQCQTQQQLLQTQQSHHQSWQHAVEEAKQQQRQLQDKLAQLTQSCADQAKSLAEGLPAYESCQARLAQRKCEFEAQKSQLEPCREQHAKQKNELSTLQQSLAIVKTQVSQQRTVLAQAEQRLLSIAESLQSMDPLVNEQACEAALQAHQQARALAIRCQTEAEAQRAHLLQCRQAFEQAREAEHQAKTALIQCQTQQSLLAEHQKKALSGGSAVQQWLQQQQLSQFPRLASQLSVTPGWESAIEAVLGPLFDAVCVDDLEGHLDAIEQVEGPVMLLSMHANDRPLQRQATGLTQYVQGADRVASWCDSIMPVASLAEAKALRATLKPMESVITPDGVWLGRHWARVVKPVDSAAGVLARAQALKACEAQLSRLENAQQQCVSERAQRQQALNEAELHSEAGQRASAEADKQAQETGMQLARLQTELKAQQQTQQAHRQHQLQWENQQQAAARSVQQLDEQHDALLEQCNSAQQTECQAREQLMHAQQRVELSQAAYDDAREAFLEADQLKTTAQQQCDHLMIRRDECAAQCTQAEHRLAQLAEYSQDGAQEQVSQLQQALAQLQEQYQACLQQLDEAQQAYQSSEQQLAQLNHQVEQLRQATTEQINQLQALAIDRKEVDVRLDTCQEQIEAAGLQLADLLEATGDQVIDVAQQEAMQQQIHAQLTRIGAVNMAAVEERESVQARYDELSQQRADLASAVQALQQAMKAMDSETETLFKQTFEQVNERFAQLFPKIFNGGQAQLTLVAPEGGPEGVQIRAQPPGKRNASIHMLSGGEKALTAIALVFSLFQLNPAPFCVLDEVDAPLDDLNVSRFARLVSDMSSSIQFLLISHNKVTIEAADALLGVTMREPGVSRIVSVDVAKAVEMMEE